MGKGDNAVFFSNNIFKSLLYIGFIRTWDCVVFNSLADIKILALTKLKAFADDNFNVTEIIICFLILLKTMRAKGENAGYQHFFPFPNTICFQKLSVSGHSNLRLYDKKLRVNFSIINLYISSFKSDLWICAKMAKFCKRSELKAFAHINLYGKNYKICL